MEAIGPYAQGQVGGGQVGNQMCFTKGEICLNLYSVWVKTVFNHISFKSIDLLFPCREVEAVKGWRSNEGVKGRAPR